MTLPKPHTPTKGGIKSKGGWRSGGVGERNEESINWKKELFNELYHFDEMKLKWNLQNLQYSWHIVNLSQHQWLLSQVYSWIIFLLRFVVCFHQFLQMIRKKPISSSNLQKWIKKVWWSLWLWNHSEWVCIQLNWGFYFVV